MIHRIAVVTLLSCVCLLYNMYINDRTGKIHAHTPKKAKKKIQFTIKGPGKRKPNASGEDIENNTGTGCWKEDRCIRRTEGNPQHGDVAQSQEELLHYITSLPTYNITCGMYTVVISISQETTTGATNEKNKTGSIIVCAAAGRRLFFFLDIYNAKKRKKKHRAGRVSELFCFRRLE